MTLEVLLLFFILSLVINLAIIPKFVQIFKEKGLVVQDKYKESKYEVPSFGGIFTFFSTILSIAIGTFLVSFFSKTNYVIIEGFNFTEIDFAVLLVLATYTIYGIIDDLVNVGRSFKTNVLIPLIFSFPLVIVINIQTFELLTYQSLDLDRLFLFDFTYGDVFEILIIPLYISVVMNLINLHSGFNGQQSGLSIIVLFGLILHSLFQNDIDDILIFVSTAGSLLSFWYFNRYPSQIFEGNVGTMFIGSCIGCAIVVQEYFFFGFFILIPHTVNFIMDFWTFNIASKKDIKFGTINSEGHIIIPDSIATKSIKFALANKYTLKEPEAVLIQNLISVAFVIAGLIIFN